MIVKPPTIESDNGRLTVLRWITLATKDAVCAIVLVHIEDTDGGGYEEYASWLVTEGQEGRFFFLLDGDYNPDYEKALEIFNERLERELRRAR